MILRWGFRDPYPSGQPWPPVLVPEGCDKLLSRGCKVTASDPDPIIGELSYATDGVKEYDMDTYIELSPGLQWIQIDLGDEKEIHAICIWHSGDLRVYHDVVVQISNDAGFGDGVATVFNNDHDNSAGLGKGKDKEYLTTHFGRPFAVEAVKGRYVRCYSRGNTSNQMNHYTEVEVYGRHIDRKQEVADETTHPSADTKGVTPDRVPVTATPSPTEPGNLSEPKTMPWKILLFVGVTAIIGAMAAWRCFRKKRT